MYIYASSIRLESEPLALLWSMLHYFRNKPFSKYQAQALLYHVLINVYNAKDNEFKRTVRVTNLAEVPKDANIIAGHAVHKVKFNDHQTLKLKACIEPHGNEGSSKLQLRTDCSMYRHSGFRIMASNAAQGKQRLTKLDMKTANLQAGQGQGY